MMVHGHDGVHGDMHAAGHGAVLGHGLGDAALIFVDGFW